MLAAVFSADCSPFSRAERRRIGSIPTRPSAPCPCCPGAKPRQSWARQRFGVHPATHICLPPRGENADLSEDLLLHLGVASATDEGAAASAAPAAASAASAFLCRHEPGNHCHSRFLEHRILPDPVRSPSRVAKGRPFHTSRPHALPRVLNCRGRAAGVVSSRARVRASRAGRGSPI